MDLNVFVDFCVIESLPAFVAEADISHLDQTLGFCSCLSCGQEDAGRRLGLRLPLPPTSWDLLETSLAGMQFWGRRGA